MNLAPRKIRGVESQGMILMAESADGDLAFVAPTKEDTEPEIPLDKHEELALLMIFFCYERNFMRIFVQGSGNAQ